eukprot:scaffold2630_cov350-Pavlova_lutheri.AAC.9
MATTMQMSKPSFVGRAGNRTRSGGKVRTATPTGVEPSFVEVTWRPNKGRSFAMTGVRDSSRGVQNMVSHRCLEAF